jgi:hypothetical protein
MTAHIDPATPAWVLDTAEAIFDSRYSLLMQKMLDSGEDITNNELWRLRKSQLDSLLASGYPVRRKLPRSPASQLRKQVKNAVELGKSDAS